jgi:hypothetical protein
MKFLPTASLLISSSILSKWPLAALTVALLVFQANAATLNGELEVAGRNSNLYTKNTKVTLYEATEFAPIALDQTTTDNSGQFQFTINRDNSNSIFFIEAELQRDITFLAILGKKLPEYVVINEITSVASSYSMAQFYRQGYIAGDAFRLQIAAQMYGNIVDGATGQISEVLRTPPNADETNSHRLTNSIANVLSACIQRSGYSRRLLWTLKNELGQVPNDTAEALANLARQPAENVQNIYQISQSSSLFQPRLAEQPDQWSITIKINDTGRDDVFFGGPANVDWDSWGYAWIANNVVQGSGNSTTYNVVLRPDGKPADGTDGEPTSPFNTGGLLGVGWGVSVDQADNIWFGNFGWGSPIDEYFPSQTSSSSTGSGTGSVSRFLSDGTPVSSSSGYFGPYRVQAIEPDDYGNIWMASFGDEDYEGGSGVWVFKDGDPEAMAFSIVDWEKAPFGIAPVADARAAWVTFSGGLSGANQSYITKYELTDNDELVQLFSHPVGETLKVVVVDFSGNAWFASQGTNSVFAYDADGNELGEYQGGGIDGPWGMAVDGEGNIWVSNFGATKEGNDFNVGRLSKLCGANPAGWPSGLSMGDPISPSTGYTVPSAGDQVRLHNGDPLYGPNAPPSYSPMMRQTSVQIDAAGNVWTINNWKPRFDVDVAVNPGGDGIIIFVGLAPPKPFN